MLSHDDLGIIARDPDLKGLTLLFDTELLINELSKDTPGLKGANCNIRYIRYKPRINCLASYMLQKNNEKIILYAKAYGQDNPIKLTKSAIRPVVPVVNGVGRKIIDVYSTEICYFPNDNKLKYINKLFNDKSRQELLKKLLPDFPNFWDVEFEIVAYKPERRLVVKLINKSRKYIVVKFYTQNEYKKAVRHSTVFNSIGNVVIPKVLGKSDKYHIMAYEWLDGVLLSDELKKHDFDYTILQDVTSALSCIHGQSSNVLGIRTLNDEFDNLKSLTETVGFIFPEYKVRLMNVSNILIKLLSDTKVDEKIIHGDFYARQVVVCDDKVGIIDFDRSIKGDPAYDIGLFIAHLYRETIKSNLSQEIVNIAKKNLLSGYKCELDNRNFINSVDTYTVLGLVSLVPHFFRDHLLNWYENTGLLISYAENVLRNINNSNKPCSISQNLNYIQGVHN